MAASDGIKQRKIVQEVSENPFNQLSLCNSICVIVPIAHPLLLSAIQFFFLGNKLNSCNFEFNLNRCIRCHIV